MATGVRAFHSGLPGYAPTPLVEAPSSAAELGVGRVFVKDESSRFGLPAFKILGVSWAVYRAVSQRADCHVEPTLKGIRDAVAELTPVELVTATDGNHGRALARMAALVGAAAGIPVLMFGADGGGAHTATEWTTIASVHDLAAILEATVADFCA
jgi:diaminopropionate ammonia-lyase